jgi:hypothetical protein
MHDRAITSIFKNLPFELIAPFVHLWHMRYEHWQEILHSQPKRQCRRRAMAQASRQRVGGWGNSLGKLVSGTVDLADAGDSAGMNGERSKWSRSNPPARRGAKPPVCIPGLQASIVAVAARRYAINRAAWSHRFGAIAPSKSGL